MTALERTVLIESVVIVFAAVGIAWALIANHRRSRKMLTPGEMIIYPTQERAEAAFRERPAIWSLTGNPVWMKKTACVGKTEPTLRSVPSAQLLSDEVDRWPRTGTAQKSATYCVPPATKDRI